MSTLPDFARPVLSSFAPVFYHPTYQRFLVLLLAAILTTGRRTVSNLLRTVAGLAQGDASSFQRVLSRRRWSTLALARILARFILDHGVPDGPVYLAGDDTVDEHKGAQVYGKGCHRDPVRSTHSYTAFRWGHKWVVLAILVSFPFATRPWALPVLAALYHSPEKATAAKAPAPKRRRRKAKDQAKARAKQRARRQAPAQTKPSKRGAGSRSRRRHKTPSELMRQLLLVLTHWFPERQFVFAGDGGYGTHALARFAARRRRNLTLVSLFYPTAALYDPPPVVVGKRPSHRPRKKGAKRPAPEAVVAATAQRQPLEVSWYGGGRRTVEVVSGTGHWHKSGDLGLRARPERDAPRHLSVQHRPGDARGAGNRDLHRPLEYRDDLPGDAGVSRLGDDAGPGQEHGVAGGAVPVRVVRGGGAVVRRVAGGDGLGGNSELSRQGRGDILRRHRRGPAAVVARGGF